MQRKSKIIAFVVMIFVVVSGTAFAQDRIIQKDGKEIKAKVLGTDSKYVRYKRFDNPNGPDYYLFRTDVLKIEYENGKTDPPQDGPKITEKPAPNEIPNRQDWEQKILKHQRKSVVFLAAGSVAIVAGAITIVKLTGDYKSYKDGIQKTNDNFTNWYQTNYSAAPPAGSLQKQESFSAFASPGIYAGGAAIVAGVALDLIGLRHIQLAHKKRVEMNKQNKELTLLPYYEPARNTTGLSVALKF